MLNPRNVTESIRVLIDRVKGVLNKIIWKRVFGGVWWDTFIGRGARGPGGRKDQEKWDEMKS